jgi:hypothetical protein
MHLAIAPVLLGSGEHLLEGIDLLQLGFRCTEHVATAKPLTSCSLEVGSSANHFL